MYDSTYLIITKQRRYLASMIEQEALNISICPSELSIF